MFKFTAQEVLTESDRDFLRVLSILGAALITAVCLPIFGCSVIALLSPEYQAIRTILETLQ